MTTKKNLRFGVIGAGRIGKIHAENLATRIPGVEVQRRGH
jgi:myo-inositol 2-dehydrogenase/D-chiro-inositol 1-dehydrogenase